MSLAATTAAETGEVVCADPRFRALLSRDDWNSLSPDIRARFSKRLAEGASAIYVGRTTSMRTTRLGWWLAQVLRLAGGPLPIHDDTGAPCIVTVTEDVAANGQTWTRLYANRKRFPQVIQSSKRFKGETGLEEYIGFGVSIALRTSVRDGALAFEDAGYLLGIGRARIKIPKFASPGRMLVTHAETAPGEFSFSLTITHPLLGEILHQTGLYREAKA